MSAPFTFENGWQGTALQTNRIPNERVGMIVKIILKIAAATVFLAASQSGLASSELFKDGRILPDVGMIVTKDSTIGGYGIYTGGRTWRLNQRSITRNNIGQSFAVIQLTSPERSDYFSEIHLVVNLQGDGRNIGFAADPCAYATPGIHKRKLPRGKDDNCLNIDTAEGKIAGSSVLTIRALIHNTKSGGRFYRYTLFFNVAQFGFQNTTKSDWTEAALAANPDRKRFAEQFFEYAKTIQDVVNVHVGSWPRDDRFSTLESIEDFRNRVMGSGNSARPETPPNPDQSRTNPVSREIASVPTPARANRPQQGTLVVKWEGYDQISRGAVTITDDGKLGQVTFKGPDNQSSCSGTYEYSSAAEGKWTISCTNDSRATGSFQLDRKSSVSTGSGTDREGKKVEFTLLF